MVPEEIFCHLIRTPPPEGWGCWSWTCTLTLWFKRAIQHSIHQSIRFSYCTFRQRAATSKCHRCVRPTPHVWWPNLGWRHLRRHFGPPRRKHHSSWPRAMEVPPTRYKSLPPTPLTSAACVVERSTCHGDCRSGHRWPLLLPCLPLRRRSKALHYRWVRRLRIRGCLRRELGHGVISGSRRRLLPNGRHHDVCSWVSWDHCFCGWFGDSTVLKELQERDEEDEGRRRMQDRVQNEVGGGDIGWWVQVEEVREEVGEEQPQSEVRACVARTESVLRSRGQLQYVCCCVIAGTTTGARPRVAGWRRGWRGTATIRALWSPSTKACTTTSAHVRSATTTLISPSHPRPQRHGGGRWRGRRRSPVHGRCSLLSGWSRSFKTTCSSELHKFELWPQDKSCRRRLVVMQCLLIGKWYILRIYLDE